MEARARDVAPILWQGVRDGKSYGVIAHEFNSAGIAPERQAPWSKESIRRIASLTRSEFTRAETQRPEERFGCVEARVRKQTAAVGQVLVELWRAEKNYEDMRDELARRGIRSPRGRLWGAGVDPTLPHARPWRVVAPRSAEGTRMSRNPMIAYYRVSTRQ